jgi:hypothetical protein
MVYTSKRQAKTPFKMIGAEPPQTRLNRGGKMRYWFMLVYLFFVQGFLSSHELSGVWSHMSELSIWMHTEYETSWGTVDFDESCIIFDFETNDWYMSDPLGSYKYVPVTEIRKESDGNYIIKIDPEYMLQETSNYEDTCRVVFLSESKNKINASTIDPAKYTLVGDGEYYKLSGPLQPDMSHYKATHKVTENLKVRITPDLSSKVPAILETGTELQILEYGSVFTVGNITAPWVKVLTYAGDTGWCFSGYLAELPKPETPTTAEVENTRQENTAGQPPVNIPPVVILAIVSGAVILAAAAVFLIRRKR